MSGAKNCPETPRQKMIGMMYLVLTAMLALNVSSEVLQGFALVDSSLRSSIESADQRKETVYSTFQSNYELNPAKVEPWMKKADRIKDTSDSLFNYIQNFKIEMIRLADGSDTDTTGVNIKAKDNLDVASQYALNQKNGQVLKEKLTGYRDLLISTAGSDSAKIRMYKSLFPLEGTPGKSWEVTMFDMMPLSAAVTLLTKYQSDIRAAEVDMLEYLINRTDADDFRVNKIQALIVPDSRYIVRGGKFSAKLVLSAIDSTAHPVYVVGDKTLNNNSFEQIANSLGTHTVKGYIGLPDRNGNVNRYHFSEQYTVGEPSATISNVDLKVVYSGIDNNFSISVPGFKAEDISVTADGATVVDRRGGNYVINPRPGRDSDITINVFAKQDGKTVPMKSEKYRVRSIPDPKSFVQYRDNGGVVRQVQEGRLAKNTIRGNDFSLIASYGPDELIQAKFSIVSFTMVTTYGSVEGTGTKLSKRQLDDINRLERGDFVMFRNIKAEGPDKKIRNLSPIQIDIL